MQLHVHTCIWQTPKAGAGGSMCWAFVSCRESMPWTWQEGSGLRVVVPACI